VENAKSVPSIEMKVLCEVLVDGSDDELLSCADESNSEQEYHSA